MTMPLWFVAFVNLGGVWKVYDIFHRYNKNPQGSGTAQAGTIIIVIVLVFLFDLLYLLHHIF